MHKSFFWQKDLPRKVLPTKIFSIKVVTQLASLKKTMTLKTQRTSGLPLLYVPFYMKKSNINVPLRMFNFRTVTSNFNSEYPHLMKTVVSIRQFVYISIINHFYIHATEIQMLRINTQLSLKVTKISKKMYNVFKNTIK